jgi:signal transduction histidine kinase
VFDEDQLRQVFVNLLANAIDASETNSPIAITTRQVERDVEDIFASARDGIVPTIKKPFVQIIITDNGCGMDEKTLERIFEPFYSTKAKGTGLGLAIVKQIVENHEGTIEIKSEVNVGTSFTIELPLNNVNENFA